MGYGSNCTLLELKYDTSDIEGIAIIPFKLHLAGIETSLTQCQKSILSCSNCTLLELKLLADVHPVYLFSVQIAPYWN